MRAYFSGKSHRLKAQDILGSGGEADVYDLGDGRALKLFKRPEHPDFTLSQEQRDAAASRLQEHQLKLPAFPQGLPDKVVAPVELAFEKRGGAISGYVMPLVGDTQPITRLGEKAYRDQGVTNGDVARVFASLHDTLGKLHQRGVVIGDFNDLNVLVRDRDGEAWVIDSDSMQFGNFRCALFTERFVDPINCDPHQNRPLQVRAHSADSDWYAFHVMLFRSLLLVDPFGGVYRPRTSAAKIPHSARPLHRITIFDPEVKFPRAARSPESLPEDLLDHFREVFERDRRGAFPLVLLERIDWQSCAACGMEFARAACPACGKKAPRPVRTTPSKLRAQTLFSGGGLILYACVDAAGHLRVLQWSDQEFRRESGAVILRGKLDPLKKFRLLGENTLLARGNQLLKFDAAGELESQRQIDSTGGVPAFDANGQNVFWIDRGQLFRDGQLGDEYIGDVLPGQTRFWVGATFGYGFYRAGGLTRAFVFDARSRGINDTVPPPAVRGQLLETSCHLSDDLAWVCCKFQDRGKVHWSLQVIDRLGKLVAAESYGDVAAAPWLESIRGAAAGGKRLLVPSDAGIVVLDPGRLSAGASLLPGSANHADGASHLLKAGNAILCVNRGEVVELAV